MLENKLGITSQIELAKEEEKITKLKALELFDTNKISEYEVGTFKGYRIFIGFCLRISIFLRER